MKWSLLVGRAWGTEIRLHISLLLLIPYALFTFAPRGPADTLRVFLLIAAIFACVGLHELGHTLAARLYGVPVTSIVLWLMGGVANLARRPEKTFPNVVIAAAGPLTNLLLFAGLLALTAAERAISTLPGLQTITRLLDQVEAFPFLVSLAIANASLALFNLIPVFPLDGGQIARGLLTMLVGEKWADLVMLFFSLPLALGLAVFGLVRGDMVILITAIILLLASLSLHPGLYNQISSLWLYFVDRGGYYLKQSDYDRAAAAFTSVIRANHRRGGAYVSRAVVWMNLSNWAAARADIDRALTIDPRNFVAWTLRGELLALEHQYEAALAAYNHATTLRDDWALAYADRGSLYQQTGRLAEGLVEINRAVDLSGGGVVYIVLRSILRHQMGDLPGARVDAETALRYAPDWMLVFPEVFLENFRGHLDWVMFYYELAIRRMPRAYQSYQGRADGFRANTRWQWAAADYSRAIELAPKSRQAELYLGRARAHLALAAPDSARQDLRLAMELARQQHITRQAEILLRSLDGPAPDAGESPAGEAAKPAAGSQAGL